VGLREWESVIVGEGEGWAKERSGKALERGGKTYDIRIRRQSRNTAP